MLEKITKGESMSISPGGGCLRKVDYNRALLNGELVGVGMFLDNSEKCSIALIKNEKGEKELIGDIDIKEFRDGGGELLEDGYIGIFNTKN